ncbi:hypothetical protein N9B94_01370 [Verrucomicrobia bacterium]|nr:hypothetical protein [Verrucomicrobiota bacterium]
MELVKETRWSRYFEDPLMEMKVTESKFRDDSVSISLNDLRMDWHDWSVEEKQDFSHAVTEATFDHLPEVYRFIMKFGDVECWGAIAAWVPRKISRDIALEWFKEIIHKVPLGKGERFFQGMALTEPVEARVVLRSCLNRIWSESTLMSEDEFFDNAAQDAVCCIEAMKQLDDDSPDLAQKYQMLSVHPININRQAAIHKLSKYFP